jgi:hypothetical protein
VVTVSELALPGRDGPELLEPVEGSFDLVAVLVLLGVEVRWPATTSLGGPPGQDIIAFRDGVRDTACSQDRRFALDP